VKDKDNGGDTGYQEGMNPMVSTLAPVVAGRPGGNDGRTRINGLACRECGDTYEIAPIHVCSRCFGPLEVQYDYDLIRETVSRETIARGPDNMWRYRDLLPLDRQGDIDWRVGWTPLVRATRLGKALGINNLWLKNDAVNPTYSFKDRVVAVASAKAKEFGFDTFACASTGNLASAVAAAGVRLGLNTYVFLPQNTERAKFLNAQVYGANVIAIDGTYDDVNRLCSEIADQRGWAFCNINVRPYYSEGSKTLAFEVAEQLGWEVPDHLVIPIASGSLLVKITKGFNELAKIGLTNGKSFKVSGAQAVGCNPVAHAFERNWDAVKPVKTPETIAKSLAIGNPADGYYVLKTTRATGGSVAEATDPEIADAMRLLASTEGIFAETAAGVTIAVLKKLAAQGKFGRDERVVAYITGNGLKTLDAVDALLGETPVVQPNLDAFEAYLSKPH